MLLSLIKDNFPLAWNQLNLQRPDVLELPIDIVVLESLITFVADEVTGNSSNVDRLWTFLPPLYTGISVLLCLGYAEYRRSILHIPAAVQLGSSRFAGCWSERKMHDHARSPGISIQSLHELR